MDRAENQIVNVRKGKIVAEVEGQRNGGIGESPGNFSLEKKKPLASFSFKVGVC